MGICYLRPSLALEPKTILHLQEFDPYGLQQTYRDEASGAELPVFAVFDLEGSPQLAFEITTDSLPTTNEPKSLPARIPFQKTEAFVRKINDRRMTFVSCLNCRHRCSIGEEDARRAQARPIQIGSI